MLSKIDIDILNTLTITELAVLRYLDNNKENVLTMSVQTIAEKNFVSTATIMRLCKKIGYSGFSELKFIIKEEIKERDNEIKNLSFESIVSEYLDNIVQTSKLLQKDTVNKIVDLMLKADNIHFFGKGLTNSIVSYFSKILFTLGVNNFIYEDTHIAYLSAEKMSKKDLVFIASLSGNTAQAIRMAQIAKSRKATIVSITSNSQNKLVSISDIPLTFYVNNHVKKIADNSSRTPALFIFDVISAVYIAKKSGTNL